MKNPPFDSLVWGSLRLAPIILCTVKTTEMWRPRYSVVVPQSQLHLNCTNFIQCGGLKIRPYISTVSYHANHSQHCTENATSLCSTA